MLWHFPHSKRQRTNAGMLLGCFIVLSATMLTGCGSSTPENQCPAVVIFEGNKYGGSAIVVAGEKRLGYANSSPCDDGYGSDKFRESAWSVAGVKPAEAIAVGNRNGAKLYVAWGHKDLSPELQKIVDQHVDQHKEK